MGVKSYRLTGISKGFDNFESQESDLPTPGHGQVLVQLRAASLNARDVQIANGTYPPGVDPKGIVPVSDGAGRVVERGSGVTKWKQGDRVMPIAAQKHFKGLFDEQLFSSFLGAPLDGVLREYAVFDEETLVRIPDYMSYEEASCLPIAYLTAWNCLFGQHKKLQAGQTLLAQGTGGVSLAAVQFAVAAGAKVILTSSSDEKLEQIRKLYPSIQTINYKQTPDWPAEAKRLQGGKGVDHIIEIAGGAQIFKSISCVRPLGSVWVVGYLEDYADNAQATKEETPDVAKAILYSIASVTGAVNGSKEEFEKMLDALEVSKIKPIIGKVFRFDQVKEAYKAAGQFVGKTVISIP